MAKKKDDSIVSSILKPSFLSTLKSTKLGKLKKPFDKSFYKKIENWKLVKLDVVDIPDESKKLLNQLDRIEDLDGVLSIECDFDLSIVFLLLTHSKAVKIKEIRFDYWCKDTFYDFKTKYKKNIERFESHYHIQPPEDLLHLQCFYEEVNSGFGEPLLGEVGGAIWLEGFEGVVGIFSDLFTDTNNCFVDSSCPGLSPYELSYVETFWYGSDSVSHGYIFDYQLNQFADIGYNSECYVRCGSLWHRFIENLSTASDFSIIEESLGTYDSAATLTYNELAASLQDAKKDCLTWFITLLACGYANSFELDKTKFTDKNKLRYELDLSDEEKESLSQNGKYYLSKTYPICLIEKIKILGKMEPGNPFFILDIFSFLDQLSIAFEPDYKPRLSERISRLLGYMIHHKKIDFLKKVGLIEVFVFDKDGMVSDVLAEQVVESLAVIAERRIEDGVYGFGFILGLMLWNFGDPITRKYSTRILSKLPDNVFHPFLKSQCAYTNDW